jgi:hypothetical protein
MYKIKRFMGGAAALIFVQTAVFAQSQLNLFNGKRNTLEKNSMLVLSSWASANILSGGVGWLTTSDESAYFHQMNAGWNLVNLGLGISGYLRAMKEDYVDYDLQKSITAQRRVNNAFLFNTALNGTYMTIGLLLKERANSSPDQASLLRGYGNSLLLQGGFLLLFDATNFILHNRNRTHRLDPIILNLSLKGNELGVVLNF